VHGHLCYKKELGFTSHRKKRMRAIKKMIARGLIDPDKDDPFELFISSTSIQYCYYRETQRILGNTFGMLVLQDFEAVTPNVLARTIETVEGGGIVVMLLKSMVSLQQLYTMSMDAHARFRTESHTEVQPRFNERFILSLASCRACLVLDDELNVLPISSHIHAIRPVAREGSANSEAGSGDLTTGNAHGAGLVRDSPELMELKASLRETQPIGTIVQRVLSVDQAKALLTFVEAAADKNLRCTVALTAGRGRGKSAAIGLSLAAAIAYGYANIFVTAPSPENLRTLFEFVVVGFDALEYKEHADYGIIESTNPELRSTVVRINVFRSHRQTIQYIMPEDASLLSQAELLVIDEAAAIPLPQVRALLGPYLVFLASTVNGYEGTGRALSLKLIQQLRGKSAAQATAAAATASDASACSGTQADLIGNVAGRTLREVTLNEPIRYAEGDPIERWLNALLCLDAANQLPTVRGCPHPSECDLYWVDRDALFSYHSASEAFLQRIVALSVASHYKNTPNDLQLLSDAPSHQLYVLLGPVDVDAKRLPEVFAIVQVSLEGEISKESVARSLGRGEAPSGDLIPWTISQQFQETEFAGLSGARVVRLAVHPDLQHMGYGSRAVQQLIRYYQGDIGPIADPLTSKQPKQKSRTGNDGAVEADKGLLAEQLAPRTTLPPLLLTLPQRPAEPLHWLGASFGLTEELYAFWHKNGFRPLYVRQTKNEVTGEHTAIVLRSLEHGAGVLETAASSNWLPQYLGDFKRRMASLLTISLRHLPCSLALSLLDPQLQPETSRSPSAAELDLLISPHDFKRLRSYARNLVDHHLVLDLVPLLARLRFIERLVIPFSSVQAAILLGCGLQCKSFDELHNELGLPVSQLLALFNKIVRKLVTALQAEHEKAEAVNLPGPTAAKDATSHMTPLQTKLSGELATGAAESLKKMKSELTQKQQAWLEDGLLRDYEIRGSEEDWQMAIGNQSGEMPPTSVNVKTDGKKVKSKDGKKQRRLKR